MPAFNGNTSGSVLQVAYNIPSGILTFSMANKSFGSITVNLYIRNNENNDISVIPYNLILNAGDVLYSSNGVRILSGSSIYITTTGSLDYYFTIE